MRDTSGGSEEREGSDVDLLRASQAGDNEALGTLLERHYEFLRAFVRLRVDPSARARESLSDVVQSVCREVLVRADRFEFRGEAAFRGWLCEAALRKVRDRFRYHRAQRRTTSREERGSGGSDRWSGLAGVYRASLDPIGRLVSREQVEALERAFDELDESQRQALTLRTLCGLSYADLAEQLGHTEAGARKVVSRARARLAEILSRAE